MSVQPRKGQMVATLRADFPQPAELLIAHLDAEAGAVAGFDLQAIPQTFRHLRLRMSLRGTKAATIDTVSLLINGGAGANYSRQNVYGLAAAAAGSEVVGGTYLNLGGQTAANALASLFAVNDLLFADYRNANKKPHFVGTVFFGTNVTTGTLYTLAYGGYYNVKAPITSMTVSFIGGNIAQYSEADLYGIY